MARLREELQQAHTETKLARAAEESQGLNVAALQARESDIDRERRACDSRYSEHVKRLEAEVVEVRMRHVQ